ncbi:MAG: RNase P modulator RnpM [bacterium]
MIERTCIVCRQKKDKRKFIRIVRTPEGKIMIDPLQRMAGRGAYVCSSIDCVKEIDKKNYLLRSLRSKIDREALCELKSELMNLLKRGDVKRESLRIS